PENTEDRGSRIEDREEVGEASADQPSPFDPRSSILDPQLTAARGAPMSMTWTCPSHCRAAGLANPFLSATKVAVCRALTPTPTGSPVSQSRPEGMSTASTFAGLPFNS